MKQANLKHLQDLQLRNQHQLKSKSQDPILGIDYGARFCGIAFSPDGSCVFPIDVFPVSEILDQIKKEVTARHIKKVVLGIPTSPNNQENEVCHKIRNLGQKIEQQLNIPVVFQNEKFSTQEGLKFKTKKEKRADHLAAAKILEYYLGY